MDTSKNQQRKNFRCVFNNYVTKDNRDGVIQSIISQFDGYYADPEVTIDGDGFILTLTVGDNLSATNVRDKILWNQFVDSVTAQDAIRKIQIIRLPKAGLMDFGGRIEGQGSVGGFGPTVDPITTDTGVDEKLKTPLTNKPRKYQIDADPSDSLGYHASVIRYADPTDTASQDQAFVHGLTPEGLSHDVTDVDSGPTTELESGSKHRNMAQVLAGFKRIAIDTDAGSAFTLSKPNGFQSVNETPRDGGLHQKATPATGIGGGAPISGASWYVTQPGNEQGTELGAERNRGDASSAPLGNITASKEVDPEEEDVRSATELPQARGGGQSVPDGGQVEGWYASNFGLNETYDYSGDIDDYDYFL